MPTTKIFDPHDKPDSDNPVWPEDVSLPDHEALYEQLMSRREHIPSERHLSIQADDFRRENDQQKRDLIDSLRRRRNVIDFGYKEI